MKTLKINKVVIENWRCFESKTVELDNALLVSGDNETGKSNFGSAIAWVLAGTDVDGKVLDDVLPVTAEPSVSPSVELFLTVADDKGIQRPCTIKKAFKAQFSRSKEYNGNHVNTFELNGVKSTQKEVSAYISQAVCDPELFALLFNSQTFTERLKPKGKELVWQKQRRIITGLLDVPDEFEQVQSDAKWELLQQGILQHNSSTTYLKALKSQETVILEELSSLPHKKEALQLQVAAVKGDKEEIENKLKETEDKIFELRTKLNEDKSNLAVLQTERMNLYYIAEALGKNKQNFTDKALQHKTKIDFIMTSIDLLEEEIASRDLPITEDVYCDKCGAVIHKKGDCYLEDEILEKTTMLAAKRLALSQAVALRNIELCVKTTVEDVAASIEADCEKANDELDAMDAKIAEEKATDEQEWRAEKTKQMLDLENYADELLEQRLQLKMNKKIQDEIDTCDKLAVDLRKQLSENQQIQDTCTAFILERCENIQQQANEMFKTSGISFSLFKYTKESDEPKETFKIYYEGKEYNSSLSYSTKIIIGYRITETLQAAYGVSIPIIIDNLETTAFNEDAAQQLILLERKEEKCPECGANNMRRSKDGLWHCSCGHTWSKTLSFDNV